MAVPLTLIFLLMLCLSVLHAGRPKELLEIQQLASGIFCKFGVSFEIPVPPAQNVLTLPQGMHVFDLWHTRR